MSENKTVILSLVFSRKEEVGLIGSDAGGIKRYTTPDSTAIASRLEFQVDGRPSRETGRNVR